MGVAFSVSSEYFFTNAGHTVRIWSNTSLEITATGENGGITITSTAGASDTETMQLLGNTYILADSGDISITATNEHVNSHFELGSSAILHLGSTSANNTTNDITSSSSNITIDAGGNGFAWPVNNVNEPIFNTTGTVSLLTTGYDFYKTWITLGSDVSGLTLGSSGNSGDIYIDEATSINGFLTTY